MNIVKAKKNWLYSLPLTIGFNISNVIAADAATDYAAAQTSATTYITSASPLLVGFFGALIGLAVVLLIGGILVGITGGRR